jgi:hypothetical protein
MEGPISAADNLTHSHSTIARNHQDRSGAEPVNYMSA